MHVWNVLHAAGWKCRTQKSRQKSPYAHHGTNLSGYIFATKGTYIDNREKPVKQQYLLHIFSQNGELRLTNGWDQLASLGHPTPANFNRFRVLTSLLHWRRSAEVSQTLHDVWPSAGLIHYIFCQVQNPGRIPLGGKPCIQVLRPSLAFSYIGSVTAQYSSSVRQPNFAAFSRGRHLYSAGRPSRWTSAHILVYIGIECICLWVTRLSL